jgi:hypothetical protein
VIDLTRGVSGLIAVTFAICHEMGLGRRAGGVAAIVIGG